MRAFDGAVRDSTVPVTAELCSTLAEVKREIVRATRVVDACVAFHRGLAARVGDAPPGYDAAGHVTAEPTGLEHDVHG
jgi:hypothetical protein